MKNEIELVSTEINNEKVTYNFKVKGEIKKYFKKEKYSMKYDLELNEIPKGIMNIPFVLNVIPIVWLFNADLKIKELDEDFYDSIEKIKKGYIDMYPMLEFNGKIKVKNIEKNNYEPDGEKCGMFFSGGLDATSTLATHYSENPLLINIQGADVSLLYRKVLKKLKQYFINEAQNYDLKITFVKSGFRTIIKEKKITKFFYEKIKDNYWHAFQHGIAIIGHAAPVAYKYKLKKVYIASSFTKGDNVKCASDPTIDNKVKLSKTIVIHDGYEYNRQDKSENIYNFLKKENKKINLRVCIEDYRVSNCCHCEKCYRTILGFASKGYDPSIVGFKLKDTDYKRIERDIKNNITIEFISLWLKIQAEFRLHPELEKDSRFEWIYNTDLEKVNKKRTKKIKKVFRKYIRRIKKIVVLIFNYI